MLTPIHHAVPGTPEALYTREHCRTRCKIEQLFGVILSVWRAIKRERVLRYAPEVVGNIITASAVLHNFRRFNG